MRNFAGLCALAGLLTATLFLAGCSRQGELPTQQLQQPATSTPGTASGGQPAADQPQPSNSQPAPAGQPATPARSASSTPQSAAAQSGAGSPPPATSSGWGSTPGKAQPSSPAPPPPPREFTLAAGTRVPVRTISTLSTKTATEGEKFEATLTRDLTVDGYVVAAKGSTVTGHVTNSDPGGKVKGVATLSVALTSIAGVNGPIPIQTRTVAQQAKSSKKKDAAKIGIGAGIGAAIGAIAGGGKGAAIGAGIGGAGGTGMVMMTKGEAAVIPSESVLTFSLSSPVTVTEKR